MKKAKKILAFILSAALTLAMAFSLSGCKLQQTVCEHQYESGGIYCIHCGAVSYDAFEFTYLEESDSYEIKARFYGATWPSKVFLPSRYNGKDVTSIAECGFNHCYSIVSVVIPNSVTSIGDYAFGSCKNLKSVSIGDNVTYIGSRAFYETPLFDNADNWKDGALYIGKYLIKVQSSISGAYTTREGTLAIGNYAFADCAELTEVLIPDSVVAISDGAFNNCASLESLEIPQSVTHIGEKAFYRCESLQDIVIPDSVTYIGKDSFNTCSSLKSIVIPDSVTYIGAGAFCFSNLESVMIGSNVTYIGKEAFRNYGTISSITVAEENQHYKSVNGSLYTKDGKTLIQYASGKNDTSFEVPSGVTTISSGAFWGCKYLETIVISNSVTSIGDYAFGSCKNLKSVVMPDSLTSIGGEAFFRCESLRGVVIPDSVKLIGKNAFYACDSLESVEFKNTDGWSAISSTEAIDIPAGNLADPEKAAEYLRSTYSFYKWERK